MSFWKNEDFAYVKIIELSDESLLAITNILTMEDLKEWLMWNDPNGIYDDQQSLKELGRIMTRDEGLKIFLRQIEENRVL